MPWSESIPQFSLVAMILGIVLVAYAAIGEPVLGRYAYAWLRRRRETESSALVRFYGLTIAIQWLWITLVVAILALSPSLNLADLGLRAPDQWGPLLAAIVGFAVSGAVIWLISRNKGGARKKGKGRGRRRGPAASEPDAPAGDAPDPGYGYDAPYGIGPIPSAGRDSASDHRPEDGPGYPEYSGPQRPAMPAPGAEAIEALTPRTAAERRLAGALAVTAGIGEELLYRGLFIALGVSFGLPVWAAAIVSCVLFAVAHLYQGWWGLVGPGLVGVLFTIVYLGTGSLVIPILLHILIDVRGLLFPGDRGGTSGGRGPGRRSGHRGRGRTADPGAVRRAARSGGGRRRRGASSR
ncbi:hypothetical protein GCM10009799_42690 [Nocardiopsis rhodophaea]|uniref:CAAX prenyl protease 2/Lysostaphin resistance protein A-like domain-containing protein n=1 Tax=Nocardiopsis rhodophaea TaxID=280238 RepID=A0ABN2THS1_9ACTN